MSVKFLLFGGGLRGGGGSADFIFMGARIFLKKGVQFGNAEMIRENQKIRANLRIDSRESGHLSLTGNAEEVEKSCHPLGAAP